jgi:sodium/bile acid cotransporter 7
MSRLQDETSPSREPAAEHLHPNPQQNPQTQVASGTTTTTTASINASKRPEWLSIVLTTLQDQWFLIGIGIVITIASQVQVPKAQQEIKETVATYLMVSIIFFFTGCTLDTSVLIQNYSRWKVHIFVQVQCFLVTSALAFGVVSATATNRDFMDPGLLVGLIFLGCVATTMSSNVVMTRQAHGNSALTVVQTTLGNFLGVFISPTLVIMYTSVDTWYNEALPSNSGQFAAIYGRVLKQLGLSIYVPMAVGQLTRYFFEPACKKVFFDWKLLKSGSLCMLVVIWQTYDGAFASGAFDSVPGDNMIFVVFISIGLFLVYFCVAFFSAILWLPRKDVVAVCYCVPAKGPAMGVPLSTTIFAGMDPVLRSKIQIPIVIFQGLQIACGGALIGVFRKWIAAEEERGVDSNGRDVEMAAGDHDLPAGDRQFVETKTK